MCSFVFCRCSTYVNVELFSALAAKDWNIVSPWSPSRSGCSYLFLHLACLLQHFHNLLNLFSSSVSVACLFVYLLGCAWFLVKASEWRRWGQIVLVNSISTVTFFIFFLIKPSLFLEHSKYSMIRWIQMYNTWEGELTGWVWQKRNTPAHFNFWINSLNTLYWNLIWEGTSKMADSQSTVRECNHQKKWRGRTKWQ